MSVFGKYSRYYDLLYRDKDYAGEAEFVAGLLKKYAPGATSLLELGCGTGNHAVHFAERNYSVHGVDRSADMLAGANARRAALALAMQSKLSFSQGDVSNCRVGKTFDAAISLFHVVSYQPTNVELAGMFATAAEHLKKDGVFIFDFWFGPAVLTERPAVRVKRMESDEIMVTRIAEPDLRPVESWVDVKYQVFIEDRKSGATEKLVETHRMRYLFLTELDLLAKSAGLRLLDSCEWLTGQKPGFDTWGVCSIMRK
jgi:SAM-dependent methyltransferase